LTKVSISLVKSTWTLDAFRNCRPTIHIPRNVLEVVGDAVDD
jgi:hypothetical protein